MALESTTCDEDGVADGAAAAKPVAGRLTVRVTRSLAEVEPAWRALEAPGVESPGQSVDFLKQWIAAFEIPPQEQIFVVASCDRHPVVAMALHRRRMWGMTVLTAFPGDHVGVNAPVVDRAFFAGLSAMERAAVWQKVRQALTGADLVYLCGLPVELAGAGEVFAGFGETVAGDVLYRAVFDSWEACDSTQRSRSRRKHDKQQGAKLDALGAVSFETCDSGAEVSEIHALMFSQRNARFRQQGIADPFAEPAVRRFYGRAFDGGGDLRGRLHVLRLDGEIVAVRYNLTHGNRMFCLISSMSTESRLQPGSPGKQCLLRVMQTEFDNGYAMFDMGSGLTDEKRHWCNVQIPLRHHYVPLTLRGRFFTFTHRRYHLLKVLLKSNRRIFGLLRAARTRVLGRRA